MKFLLLNYFSLRYQIYVYSSSYFFSILFKIASTITSFPKLKNKYIISNKIYLKQYLN